MQGRFFEDRFRTAAFSTMRRYERATPSAILGPTNHGSYWAPLAVLLGSEAKLRIGHIDRGCYRFRSLLVRSWCVC